MKQSTAVGIEPTTFGIQHTTNWANETITLEAVHLRYTAFTRSWTISHTVPFSTIGLGFNFTNTLMLLSLDGDVLFMQQLPAFIGEIASVYHGIVHCKALKFYCYWTIKIQFQLKYSHVSPLKDTETY